MNSRDIPSRKVRQMYDLLAMQSPMQLEKLRLRVRLLEPRLSYEAAKRRVIDAVLKGNDVATYHKVSKVLARPGREPRGTSPLERIKGRTAWLNPFGKQTGGNFRANY